MPLVRRDGSAWQSNSAMVLYDDRSITLDGVRTDAKDPAALWIRTRDLPLVNEFEMKPEGACRADVCIPGARSMVDGDSFNLTAFARHMDQAVVAEASARVWSLGEMPLMRGAFYEERAAPDFSVSDRQGRSVRLSDFRGKKVLVITWASW